MATTEAVVLIACMKGRIHVDAPFALKGACKIIPGARWKGGWSYPATATSAHNISVAFAGEMVEIDDAFKQLVAEYALVLGAAAHKEDDDPPDIPLTATTPWLHQKRGFAFARDLKAAGLFLEMGAGKSKIVVDLVVNNGTKATLILCPLSVVPVWKREFGIHAGAPVHVVCLSAGSVANRAFVADRALPRCPCGKPHVLVINYEAAFRAPFAEWALDQRWGCVILDEAHRIKAVQGMISRFCYQLSKRADRRFALTGTPMALSPLDVFGLYRFLDPDIFGLSYSAFKRKYAEFGGYGGYELVGYLNQEELHERVYSIAYRVTADEVLDLPPTLDVRLTTQLEPQARGIYKDVERALYAELEVGALTAPNILVKLLRLQQITGGSVVNDEGEAVLVGTEKKELLVEYLDQLAPREPVIVFCRFVHDLDVVEQVTTRMGRSYAELSGRRKDGINSDARMNEEVDVVGVQIQAGGVGVDLTRAHYAAYYSVGYSLSDYEQSRARLNRPGQKHSVLYTHLVVTDTIDEDVYEALEERKSVVDYVLDGLR